MKLLLGDVVGKSIWFVAAAVLSLSQMRGADPKVKPLTALDYLEIQQLNYKYAFALDNCSNHGEDYANLYTDDGVFVVGLNGMEYKGHAEAGEGCGRPHLRAHQAAASNPHHGEPGDRGVARGRHRKIVPGLSRRSRASAATRISTATWADIRMCTCGRRKAGASSRACTCFRRRFPGEYKGSPTPNSIPRPVRMGLSPRQMKIALAQTNSTVGDLCGNAKRMLEFSQRAAEAGANVVVFPELSLTGYPPRDLLEKESFLDRTEQHLERLAADAAPLNLAIICGTVTRTGASAGHPIYNSAAVLRGGRIAFRQHKMLLPTYDVFDEARYFEPATKQSPLALGDAVSALTICEDAWNDKQYWERRRYSRDPVEELASAGARILISINASPYHMGKRAQRTEIFAATARHFRVPHRLREPGGRQRPIGVRRNQLRHESGRRGDRVRGFVRRGPGAGGHREVDGRAPRQLVPTNARRFIRRWPWARAITSASAAFERVIIGLSGGIDSALTAAIAVDAVGKENVIGVGMPGPYSSEHSVTDARDLAQQPGHPVRADPDQEPVRTRFLNVLEPLFDGASRGRDGREPAIASARRHADGALEQMGRAGAHHGQQERAGGGLLHALRRYVRRTGGDQRRAENAGVFARARRQPAPRERHSGEYVHASRRRPSCVPIRRIPIRFRPTKYSIRFCVSTSRITTRRSISPTRFICL